MRWTKKKLIKFNILLWVLTFGLILPIMAQKWIFSPLFYNSNNFKSKATTFVDKLNAERFVRAQSYLESINENNKDIHARNLQNATMVAVIITKRREICSGNEFYCEPHYLQQVVAALDADMKNHTSGRSGTRKKEDFVPIILCNVDKHWKNHLDFSLVGNQFPTILIRNNDSNIDSHSHSRTKESQDYAMCLQSALELSNPKYLLVLEDDAMSFNGIFENIFYILDFRVEHKMLRGTRSENEQWGWVKLYYPEIWSGFGLEKSKIIELISVAVFSAAVHYLIAISVIKVTDPFTFVLIFSIMGCLYALLVVLVMSRQTFLEIRRLHPFFFRISPDLGCCTPAVLYTTKYIPQIVKYLKSSQCHRCHLGVDLALNDFRENNNLTCHLVEPSLVRHLGMHSTLTGNKDPRSFLFYDFMYKEISNLIVRL